MKLAIIGGYNFERHSKSMGKLKNIELRFHDGVPKKKQQKGIGKPHQGHRLCDYRANGLFPFQHVGCQRCGQKI